MNSMTALQALLLGLVQGLTEFLPVSSSGHLILFPDVFGFEGGGLGFDTVVHLGTFLAVLLVLWPEIVGMSKGLLGSGAHRKERSLALWVVAATVPVVVVGLLIGDLEMLRTTPVVAGSLIVWGVVLGVADIVARRRGRSIHKAVAVGWKRSMLVGLSQVLALIPGTSRSGITMSAGLLSGLDRKTAARFSFLLSLPAVGGAGLYVLIDALREGVSLFSYELAIGFLAAFFSGVLAIRFLLRLVERFSFMPFAVYRVLLGAALLIWFV